MAQASPLFRSPWLRRLVLPAVFLLCFVIFLFLTLPLDEAARSLEERVRAQGGELTIERLRPSGLGGIAASGVKLRLPAAPGADPLPDLQFDKVTARPDYLSLLLRRVSFSFSIEAYGGKASGHAELTKDQRQGVLEALSLNAADLDLARLPLKELVGLEVTGRVALKADLSKLSPPDVASGLVSGTLKGVSASGPVKGFTVPKTSLGDVDLQIALDKGAAKIDRAQARNGDVDADLDGTLRLKPLMTLSQAELHARFKLSEAWLNQNPIFRGLLSAIANARQPDGAYVFTLTGPLANLSSRPGR